jgi:hypothetical protein
MKPTPLALTFLLALAFAPTASAQQTRGAEPPPPGRGAQGRERASEAAAAADESFNLDIPFRRTVEEDFQAATEVEAGGDSTGLRVRVGAFVRAERIELVLRGVRGFVRFRASLTPVLRLLDGGREPTGARAPAETSP